MAPIVPVGRGCQFRNPQGGKLNLRKATVLASGVRVYDSSAYTYGDTTGTGAVNNDYNVPYRIYGIKGVGA